MKLAPAFMAALVVSFPALALACPYSSGAAGCSGCSSPLLGYGMSLLVGLGIGFLSVQPRT
jgi:hypothetical protein